MDPETEKGVLSTVAGVAMFGIALIAAVRLGIFEGVDVIEALTGLTLVIAIVGGLIFLVYGMRTLGENT